MAEKPKSKTSTKPNLADKLKAEEATLQQLTTIHARMAEQILRAQGRVGLLRELIASAETD